MKIKKEKVNLNKFLNYILTVWENKTIMNRYIDGLSLILTRWPIGLLPGKLQERIARRYHRESHSYFYAQIFGSTCLSLGVYTAGQLMENPDSGLLKYIDEVATGYVLAGRILPTAGRYLLSRKLKRPIGSYVLEAGNILLGVIAETKPVKKSLEKIIDITEKLKKTV